MVGEWRQLVDDYTKEKGGTTRVIFVETFGALEDIIRYYADSEGNPRAHFPFNFMLLKNLDADSTARDFKNTIDTWMSNIPVGATSNWVVGSMAGPEFFKLFFLYSLGTMMHLGLVHVTE